MRIKSDIGLAVGPTDAKNWGQVLVTPSGYGIIEISDSDSQAQKKGARILSHLGEKLSRELVSLSSVDQVADDVWEAGITSLIILVPVGRVVYLVLRGAGAVYVKRDRELARLMHTQGAVSGEVQRGDTLLLVSEKFSRAFTHEDITGIFDNLTAPRIAEKLTLLLHEKKYGEGSVALVFGIEDVEGEEEPVVLAAPPRTKIHRPKDMRRAGVFVLIALFLLSVGIGIWKQAVAQKNEHVETAFLDAQHSFEEGAALLALNPVKGRERLMAAKETLAPFVSQVNARTKEGRDVKSLHDQINDYLTQSLQITDGLLALFYDMELMKKGATATSMVLTGKTLVVGDAGGSAIYTLDIVTKKVDVVAGGAQTSGVSSVAIHGSVIYGLTPSAIVSINLVDKKSTLLVLKNDAWGSVSSLISFGGNLYLLDTIKSRIWKYTATSKGFSEIREYLNPDSLPDFSLATAMTIDGSVWIGTKSGKIFRFVQGAEETFLPKGVEPALGKHIVPYVTDETKNIYLLDKELNRVVVLDKDGTYLAQYRFDAGTEVSTFVVSEDEKKILFLSGGKIYSIDLK